MYDDLVLISHDPFGRWSLYRECLDDDRRGECAFCGSYKGRFAYYTWDDGIYTRPERIKGRFCSKGCMIAYHGI